jgi:hypothetical protein
LIYDPVARGVGGSFDFGYTVNIPISTTYFEWLVIARTTLVERWVAKWVKDEHTANTDCLHVATMIYMSFRVTKRVRLARVPHSPLSLLRKKLGIFISPCWHVFESYYTMGVASAG